MKGCTPINASVIETLRRTARRIASRRAAAACRISMHFGRVKLMSPKWLLQDPVRSDIRGVDCRSIRTIDYDNNMFSYVSSETGVWRPGYA